MVMSTVFRPSLYVNLVHFLFHFPMLETQNHSVQMFNYISCGITAISEASISVLKGHTIISVNSGQPTTYFPLTALFIKSEPRGLQTFEKGSFLNIPVNGSCENSGEPITAMNCWCTLILFMMLQSKVTSKMGKWVGCFIFLRES